jgi:hypothetical protein
MNTIAESKSAACRRQLLLDSVDSVNEKDIDQIAMDTSAAHRALMREKLYGKNRIAKIIKGIMFRFIIKQRPQIRLKLPIILWVLRMKFLQSGSVPLRLNILQRF